MRSSGFFLGLLVALMVAPVAAAQVVSSAAGTGKAAVKKPADDMVKVPAGKFQMGCNEKVDTECAQDEKPAHEVWLDAFSIDRTEVTVADYRLCVDAGACSSAGVLMPFWGRKQQPDWAWACNWDKVGQERHPMNCVTWEMADAYCRWLGKRLPTEAQWEKAARGTDGRKYPWGNTGFPKAGRVANIADESAKKRYPDWSVAKGYDDGSVASTPVGSFPKGASPYGALDMIGNAHEWVADWYDKDYYVRPAAKNPDGAPSGEARCIRGGSWEGEASFARCSYRFRMEPEARYVPLGFRCAR